MNKVDSRIAKQEMHGMEVTEEMMKRYLKEDLHHMLGLLYCILESPVLLDLVAKNFHETHIALRVQEAADQMRRRQEMKDALNEKPKEEVQDAR